MQCIVSLNGNAIATYEGVSQEQALRQAQIDFPPSIGERRVAQWAGNHYTSTKMQEIRKLLSGDIAAKASQQDVDFCPFLG